MFIVLITLLTGTVVGVNARETETLAAPMWHVDMQMIVDQVEEFMSAAANITNRAESRKDAIGVLSQFFIAGGEQFFIGNDFLSRCL